MKAPLTVDVFVAALVALWPVAFVLVAVVVCALYEKRAR